MTAYYSDESVTIYHGDCREVLPQVSADALLTDPPYGIGYSPGSGGTGWTGDKTFVGRDLVRGDAEPFDPADLLALNLPSILWGGNHYASRLPDNARWLVWDKREGFASNDFADCELAWTNLSGTARLFHHRWMGALRSSERATRRLHPTQKPLSLMRWCIGLLPDATTILDPYTGSGSTLRAAKDLGRKAIGIEIEERYCQIAAQRMGQEVLAV